MSVVDVDMIKSFALFFLKNRFSTLILFFTFLWRACGKFVWEGWVLPEKEAKNFAHKDLSDVFPGSSSISNRNNFTRTLFTNWFDQAEIRNFLQLFYVIFILPFLPSCHFGLGLPICCIMD